MNDKATFYALMSSFCVLTMIHYKGHRPGTKPVAHGQSKRQTTI